MPRPYNIQIQRSEPLSKIQGILERSIDAQLASELCTDELLCTALLLDCTSKTITDSHPYKGYHLGYRTSGPETNIFPSYDPQEHAYPPRP